MCSQIFPGIYNSKVVVKETHFPNSGDELTYKYLIYSHYETVDS